MTKVFADTFFFFAFLDEQDQSHEAAVSYLNGFEGDLVTTEWVLTELADGFASTRNRATFSRFYRALREQPEVQIIPSDSILFQAGMDLYATRPDKRWSLTDCISFAVMKRLGLKDALTGDHHFQQAGFNRLLSY